MNNESFDIGDYPTEHEAAFAYNVAACLFEGPTTELNKGLNLTAERKQQIEQEVLQKVAAHIGRKGFAVIVDADTDAGKIVEIPTCRVVRHMLSPAQRN